MPDAESAGPPSDDSAPSQAAGQQDDLPAGWARIVRGVEAVQSVFAQRLEQVGMSLPYFSVLRLLAEAPDERLPMSRIARDLAMTSGGFTKLADRMARDGFIDRRGSAGDRRVVFAALTDAGREHSANAMRAYERFVTDELSARLTPEGLTTMAELAGRLDGFGIGDRHPGDFEAQRRDPDARERRSDR